MSRITRRSEALNREQFHAALQHWLDSSTAETIGDTSAFKGKAWIIITDGSRFYHLNADTTRQGVAGYLDSVKQYGSALAWAIRETERGNMRKVVFGPHQIAEFGFFLFAYAG